MRCRSANEFWSFAQRYLSFDEPAEIYRRLKQLLAKQLGRSESSISQTSLPDQDQIFNEVYGSESPAPECVLFNLFLGSGTIRRFQSSAFRLWLSSISVDSKLTLEGLIRQTSYPSPIPSFIASLIDAQKLDPACALWLYRSSQVVPDWAALKAEGPWSDDPRAQFVIACLKSLKGESLSAEGFTRARNLCGQVMQSFRSRLPGNFSPELILLVEGPTEALLIPPFAASLDFNLDHNGVAVIPAGGANQVARQYLEQRELVSLPIMVALDGDAKGQAETVGESLRSIDRLKVLSQGEIEDTFDMSVLLKYLNLYLKDSKMVAPILAAEFKPGERRVDALNRLWRQRGLGDFDKIGFARSLTERGFSENEVPSDIKVLVQDLRGMSAETIGNVETP